MKKLFSIVPALMMLWATVAQGQTARTVTINVEGNRTKQVAVDNKYYTVDNTTTGAEKNIEITNLANGQHQLQIYRTYSTNPAATTFTLREGYDMTITVSSNGSVSMTESRTSRWNRDRDNNDNNNTVLSTNAFNKLYNATKAKSSSSARTSYLTTQFAVTNRRMTSQQAKQLIQLVNSESSRLKLAKQVYPLVTDKSNFSLVSNLLNSSSNRAELNNYIATIPDNDDTETTESNAAYVAMTPQKFNVIYNEVLAESTQSDRNYYLINFFSKDFNYFTSAQVRQLLTLISSEAERFSLAKSAYRGITDREYYYNEIAPLLSNNYNRADLKAYLNQYDSSNPTGTTTRVAMTSTAFNSLYQKIYYESAGLRYNSINSAFYTSGNYFTAAQARQLIQLVTDENSRLALAKAAYVTLVDRTNYTLFNDLFNYQSTRNEFNTYVVNYNNGTVTNPTTNVAVAMTDTEFNTLYRNVNNAWTSSNRFNLVSNAFQSTTNWFSASQIRQLLTLITSESDKLSLAKLSYDNMVDQYNYTVLNDVFTSSSSRTEWARFVTDFQNGGTGTTYRVAMTDSEFNSLYRSVQLTFGLGAKYSSLTDIFSKETNYFTSAQTKQLIQLVSSESNRLDLAKLAYNNVVDPANYTTLYDILASQTSKDELAAYISANSNIR